MVGSFKVGPWDPTPPYWQLSTVIMWPKSLPFRLNIKFHRCTCQANKEGNLQEK